MAVLRRCLREPIDSIEVAARMLDAAVTAHLNGDASEALRLLIASNLNGVRDWTESLWGKGSDFAPRDPYFSNPPLRSVPERMPDTKTQAALHDRDGYYCRFCGIPVIRKQVRERLRKLYSAAALWGRRNQDQHAALQCMWAQYDHVLPHSRGGTNELLNVVVTCAPCNFGRMQYTLEEAALQNPLTREPRRGPWDGLERLLHASPAGSKGAA